MFKYLGSAMDHSARVRIKSGESVGGPSAELSLADIPKLRNILAYGELLMFYGDKKICGKMLWFKGGLISCLLIICVG